MRFWEAAFEVLKTSHRPMTVREVWDEVRRRRFPVPRTGETPTGTMSTELRRKSGLFKLAQRSPDRFQLRDSTYRSGAGRVARPARGRVEGETITGVRSEHTAGGTSSGSSRPRVLPERLFNRDAIATAKVSGKGGKEPVIHSLFPGARRSGNPLYDFVLTDGGTEYRIEVKKQQDLQWFDISKLHRLTGSERQVVVVFVLHAKGRIDMVAAISLGALLDTLLTLPDLKEYGWTARAMEEAAKLKSTCGCPKLQFKSGLKVREFVAQQAELFQFLYRM